MRSGRRLYFFECDFLRIFQSIRLLEHLTCYRCIAPFPNHHPNNCRIHICWHLCFTFNSPNLVRQISNRLKALYRQCETGRTATHFPAHWIFYDGNKLSPIILWLWHYVNFNKLISAIFRRRFSSHRLFILSIFIRHPYACRCNLSIIERTEYMLHLIWHTLAKDKHIGVFFLSILWQCERVGFTALKHHQNNNTLSTNPSQ